jgi:hypothetical protein
MERGTGSMKPKADFEEEENGSKEDKRYHHCNEKWQNNKGDPEEPEKNGEGW